MEKNTKIILSLLILILLIVLPFFAVSFKLDLNKKELHVDRQRYEKVNRHCFEKKSSKSCLALLKQDLNILKATILSVIGRETILRTENQCSNRIHLPFKKSIGYQLMIL